MMRSSRLLAVAVAGALLSGISALPALASTDHNLAKAERILTRLVAPGGLAHYRLPTGRIATATVCVRTSCVSRTVSTPPPCSTPVCLAPAEIARKYHNGELIDVQIY